MLSENINIYQYQVLSLFRESETLPRVGFEREGLRIENSSISQNHHPKSLGSALCNKYITTDFSEAQLELVTPPYENKNKAMQFLDDIHHFVSNKIDDQIIWPFSMPLGIDSEEQIAIASYGDSNLARFKKIYRNGLFNRYGKMMQTISGVHYNYSVPDTIWENELFSSIDSDSKEIRSSAYFNMLRNIFRLNWLILYLFGASPALNKKLLNDDSKAFKKLDKETFYMPYSTSLRMSEYGYQNEDRKNLEISINSMEQYILDLQKATTTKHEDFTKIKSIDPDNQAQINGNILQIDDEYYAIARAKSKDISIKPTTFKLKKTGVDFIELRSLDIDPFSRTGISEEAIFFLELLLTYCFIEEAKPFTPDEIKNNNYNHSLVAKEGRNPNIKLSRDGQPIGLIQWGKEIIDDLYPIADALDCKRGKYSSAVESAKDKLNNPNLTLSAKMLDLLNSENISILELGMNIGNANKDYYLKNNKSKNKSWSLLSKEAKESVIRQDLLEKSDNLSFGDYLESYFNI